MFQIVESILDKELQRLEQNQCVLDWPSPSRGDDLDQFLSDIPDVNHSFDRYSVVSPSKNATLFHAQKVTSLSSISMREDVTLGPQLAELEVCIIVILCDYILNY